MKRVAKLLIALLVVVGLGLGFNSKSASARGYLNGNSYASIATRYVKVTKKMPVYKVRTGKNEASNRYYRHGSIKKGTKLHISYKLMSTGGWIIKSKKYYHNHRTFFMIRGRGSNWYKRIR